MGRCGGAGQADPGTPGYADPGTPRVPPPSLARGRNVAFIQERVVRCRAGAVMRTLLRSVRIAEIVAIFFIAVVAIYLLFKKARSGKPESK